MNKLAILDTDFIIKGCIAKSDNANRLMDRILELPDYKFYCHEQTLVELSDHDNDALTWLTDKISNGHVCKYTDDILLNELTSVYHDLALWQYTNLLKNACDAFDQSYFNNHFNGLNSYDYSHKSIQDYLTTLRALESKIGKHNSLGEIKEYIVLQWLNIKQSHPVFYFCSDDGDARKGALVLDNVDITCLSFLSSFQRLISCNILTAETIQPYVESTQKFFRDHKQKTVTVKQPSDNRNAKILYEDVFRDIIGGRFIELKNGCLQYKPFQ